MVGGGAKADHPRRPAGRREERSRQGASGEAPHHAADRAQPPRRLHTVVDGDLDPRCLLESDATSTGRATSRAGFVAEAEHSDGIASFVLTDDAPLSWDAFARAMETLIALRGPDLLRVKGLLNVAGCRGPVVVHVVQHLAHPPVELTAWPGKDRASRLVFITRGISETQVRDLLASVRALAVDSG